LTETFWLLRLGPRFVARNRLREFESLAQVVAELRPFLLPPLERARTGEPFTTRWIPGGPWLAGSRNAHH